MNTYNLLWKICELCDNNHTSWKETTLCLQRDLCISTHYPFFKDFRTTLLDCFKISNQTIKLILCILIDNWIFCLIHCWKLWFCEHIQKQTKEHSYCTLWSKNFGNSRLRWKLILLDGYFNLTFLSTKKLEFYWFPEKLD